MSEQAASTAVADEARPATRALAGDDPLAEEELLVKEEALIEDELLVEEVSIDGMCGVY